MGCSWRGKRHKRVSYSRRIRVPKSCLRISDTAFRPDGMRIVHVFEPAVTAHECKAIVLTNGYERGKFAATAPRTTEAQVLAIRGSVPRIAAFQTQDCVGNNGQGNVLALEHVAADNAVEDAAWEEEGALVVHHAAASSNVLALEDVAADNAVEHAASEEEGALVVHDAAASILVDFL